MSKYKLKQIELTELDYSDKEIKEMMNKYDEILMKENDVYVMDDLEYTTHNYYSNKVCDLLNKNISDQSKELINKLIDKYNLYILMY